MKKHRPVFKYGAVLLGILLLYGLLYTAELKLRVIVDDSSIKATPEITGNTLAKVALNTILDRLEKVNGWYKVSMEKEGVKISGYIHEMLVEEIREEDIPEIEPLVSESGIEPEYKVIGEIETKIESGKESIRQGRDLEYTIETLRPLIARAFRISDDDKQKELATEVFLWIALAYAELDKDYEALREMRNMLEVDYDFAQEISRNIIDAKIVALFSHAERQFSGEITEYSLDITTTPPGASVKVNGVDKGFSPGSFTSQTPEVSIEIEKPGYKKIDERIFFTEDKLEKEYTLEQVGRNIALSSDPPGGNVFLDGTDTGKLTDCVLSNVRLGSHKLQIFKENYIEWEAEVDLGTGDEPFQIAIVLTGKKYEYSEKWGGPTSKVFKVPVGIAIDNQNNVFIIDESSAKVKKRSPEGRSLEWTIGGSRYPGLKNPAGIAIDEDGYLFITDAKRHSVFKINNDGEYVSSWGKEGSKDREFRSPRGVSINRQGDIYVADTGNNRIKKYSNTGELKEIIGMQGATDGSFISPMALAFNQDDELLVLDRLRVQKFSPQGEFMTSWRLTELIEGGVLRASGIYIDRHGYIYLLDAGKHKVLKLDPEFKLVVEWGAFGPGNGQFNYPLALTIDDLGRVFVVERENNRIQVFVVPNQ